MLLTQENNYRNKNRIVITSLKLSSDKTYKNLIIENEKLWTIVQFGDDGEYYQKNNLSYYCYKFEILFFGKNNLRDGELLYYQSPVGNELTRNRLFNIKILL